MGKTLYKIIVIASLIGLFVSSYLTYSYYAEKSVVCINKEHVNICDDVLNSSYSKLFFNIPNSLIGIFGFLLLLKLSYYGINGKDVKRLILFFSSVACLFDILCDKIGMHLVLHIMEHDNNNICVLFIDKKRIIISSLLQHHPSSLQPSQAVLYQ